MGIPFLTAADMLELRHRRNVVNLDRMEDCPLPYAVAEPLCSVMAAAASQQLKEKGIVWPGADDPDQLSNYWELEEQELIAFLAPLDQRLPHWIGDLEMFEPRHQAAIALWCLTQIDSGEARQEPITRMLFESIEAVAAGKEWQSQLQPSIDVRPYDSIDEELIRDKAERAGELIGEEREEGLDEEEHEHTMVWFAYSPRLATEDPGLILALDTREGHLISEASRTWSGLVDWAAALLGGTSMELSLVDLVTHTGWSVLAEKGAAGARDFLVELNERVCEAITAEMAVRLQFELTSLSQPGDESGFGPASPELGH